MRDYKVICRYSTDDGAYLAYAPEYPGCVADGQTPGEAGNELDVVVGMWKDIAKEDGINTETRRISESAGHNITIEDVANYILSVKKSATTYQLQKWLYYCKAWCEAWGKGEFFAGDFVKFDDGPVNRQLFHELQGKKTVHYGDVVGKTQLTSDEKNVVDSVLEVYGDMSGDQLSAQTHLEDPWKQAGKNETILPGKMGKYYASLIS